MNKFMSAKMRKIIPGEIPIKDLHQFMIGTVAPRPIAFVSTVNEDGQANIAPYSFFNAFSSNPPIVVFSSNRRVRDNTTKDTLHNIITTKEAVINVVSYDIVRQMAVSSVEYPPEVNEFDKSGLTPVPAECVNPPRVAESPAQLECKVRDIITLGEHGGAGHLIICDVVMMHIREDVIDEKNRIDPHKIDLMGRMGKFNYVRASGAAVQPIVQLVNKIAIGYDSLPESVQKSDILSGNDIGLLAGMHHMPTWPECEILLDTDDNIKALMQINAEKDQYHKYAKEALRKQNVDFAMKILMLADRQ
jgi:flavin reductase (DIM6/NTAB) family NADH-FMN oxidoreductase RutF